MTRVKKEIYVFVVVTIFVSIVNIIQCYNDTKIYYTIDYPKTVEDVQKSIDNEIIEINDKVVTKGSVIILATREDGTLCLYHLERGFLTLRYRKYSYGTIGKEDRKYTCHIKNNFEKFDMKVTENNRIEINPATFTGNISWDNIVIGWLLPIVAISAFVITHFVIQREKKQ